MRESERASEMEMRRADMTVTLEQYRRFYDDPWGSDLSRSHLNQIINMHGFTKLHNSTKMAIREALWAMELMPATRSTLDRSISCCAPLTAADAAADLAALGWQECTVRTLRPAAAQQQILDAAHAGEDDLPVARAAACPPSYRRRRSRRYRWRRAPPADFVVRGRRPRSKRRRASINALLASLPTSVTSRAAATEAVPLSSLSSPLPSMPSPSSSPIPCPPPYPPPSPPPPPSSPPPLWL